MNENQIKRLAIRLSTIREDLFNIESTEGIFFFTFVNDCSYAHSF